MAKADSGADMLQGTLDLLILHALSHGPMHGWGISRRIRELSRDVLRVNQGSLYPALHRLEYRGLIEAEWGTSENNRRARYYRLTPAGRRQLNTEVGQWKRIALAISFALEATCHGIPAQDDVATR
jgi:transcriptional regulator